jgi:hypothetical protein
MASMLARQWAIGQIPQTREAIFGTYGELLNTPDRGDGEPVSSLDDPLIIHLQGELGVAFMSRGWRDLYNFRNGIASFSIRCSSGCTVVKALSVRLF